MAVHPDLVFAQNAFVSTRVITMMMGVENRPKRDLLGLDPA